MDSPSTPLRHKKIFVRPSLLEVHTTKSQNGCEQQQHYWAVSISNQMHWQLDHVFLACADREGPEKVLSDFGLSFTESRIHRGQGTANVCALFENAFFELLFPFDDEELQSEAVKPLGLKERIHWRKTGACPFGVCFRPAEPLAGQSFPPVETWSYASPYQSEGSGIPIVTPKNSIKEPLVFLSTRARPVANTLGITPKHCGDRRTLTKVVVECPENACLSAGVQWFMHHSTLSLVSGSKYHLNLVWDGGNTAEQAQFGNSVPIGIGW